MKRFIAGIVAMLSACATAQQPWQKIQMLTAAEVAERWGRLRRSTGRNRTTV